MPELLEFNVKAKRKPVAAATTAAVKGAILIQEGKKYVTRYGDVIGPMTLAGTLGNYSAKAFRRDIEHTHESTCWWRPNGLFQGLTYETNPYHPMHIVKEYEAAPAPTHLPLVIGKKYFCVNGKYVIIRKPSATNPACVMADSDDGFRLKYDIATGKRWFAKDQVLHPWHIVGQVEEPKQYVSGQIITVEEADKLYKTVQIQFGHGNAVNPAWSNYPKDHHSPPSNYANMGWKWRIK